MRLLLLLCASGLTVFSHGVLDAQIADATRAIAADPNNAQLYVRRGELHRLHRDWPHALADFAQAERRAPADPAYLLGRARVHYDCSLDREAIESLNAYLARRPGSELALVLRAQAHSRMGAHKPAAADYAAAIRASQEPQPDWYLGRAIALAALADDAGALAAIDAGLARLGPLPSLEQWAISHLESRKRYNDALTRLASIIARTERKETLLARRAELLAAAGRVAEAREANRQALEAWQRLPERIRQTRAMVELRARLEAR